MVHTRSILTAIISIGAASSVLAVPVPSSVGAGASNDGLVPTTFNVPAPTQGSTASSSALLTKSTLNPVNPSSSALPEHLDNGRNPAVSQTLEMASFNARGFDMMIEDVFDWKQPHWFDHHLSDDDVESMEEQPVHVEDEEVYRSKDKVEEDMFGLEAHDISLTRRQNDANELPSVNPDTTAPAASGSVGPKPGFRAGVKAKAQQVIDKFKQSSLAQKFTVSGQLRNMMNKATKMGQSGNSRNSDAPGTPAATTGQPSHEAGPSPEGPTTTADRRAMLETRGEIDIDKAYVALDSLGFNWEAFLKDTQYGKIIQSMDEQSQTNWQTRFKSMKASRERQASSGSRTDRDIV
ncbi:hypothetical protein GGU10DRAFT_359403 [Lentinula aff. detonsa]|uniref:Uncharacterized protein n=1 Tax=Lentinula aff. detonsa TaxID=2804958 RepID=A0AA38KFE5_9AGAR|nr:hypothetical protein GGU10DRAFT_359403 [Lentinula aff. detonsa]